MMKLRMSALLTVAVAITPFVFTNTMSASKVVFHPPSQSGGGGPPESDITETSFTFFSPTGTSPGTSPCVIDGVDDDVCDFLNVSGVDWTVLEFTVAPGGDLTSCQPLFGFTNCDVLQPGDSTSPSIFTFTGGTGIPDGTAFGFSVQGWATNTEFDVVANTPEPSKSALLLVGLLIAFAVIKKYALAKRPNSNS